MTLSLMALQEESRHIFIINFIKVVPDIRKIVTGIILNLKTVHHLMK